jgi:hypothetical protein
MCAKIEAAEDIPIFNNRVLGVPPSYLRLIWFGRFMLGAGIRQQAIASYTSVC